ncbi:NERD domain-containing protein [Bacillus shivajii]|uniref:nuclease-related domain-containing protein n=1 Tax=Bacillus shivajii TaxID=1983719 RepID=UPI001CFABFFA|nr:nuclease-related domain-containing protein [Bacillus shivajii]UCZ53800.1 NERD domain-containing protein [Bacillus shivajii]
MIIKPRTYPLELRRLEALLARLPETHPQWNKINDEFSRRSAGFKGERLSDYFLQPLQASKEHLILSDLRLHLKGVYFQMDTLILTRKFILVLEIKNIIGQLIFDHAFQQLIRSNGEKKDIFPCPINQVENNVWQLGQFLIGKNFDRKLPVYGLVVITNQGAEIMNEQLDNKVRDTVVRGRNLLRRITSLEKRCSEEKISMKELNKISNVLKRAHSPWLPDYESPLVPVDDIIPGIRCLECGSLPIDRAYSCWYCENCKAKTKHSYKETLVDYALLISPTIKTREYMNFSLLHSMDVAYRHLNHLRLPTHGAKKNREYDLIKFVLKRMKEYRLK